MLGTFNFPFDNWFSLLILKWHLKLSLKDFPGI